MISRAALRRFAINHRMTVSRQSAPSKGGRHLPLWVRNLDLLATKEIDLAPLAQPQVGAARPPQSTQRATTIHA